MYVQEVGDYTLIPPPVCEHCGSSREHIEVMAEIAGITDPICCEPFIEEVLP